MKSIAIWARDHKWTARIIIGASHINMLILAGYIGFGLRDNSINIPPTVFWTSATLFTIVTLSFTYSYSTITFNKRKILDAIVLTCGFIMMISFANQKDPVYLSSYNSLHGSHGQSKVEPSSTSTKNRVKELKKQFRELKKLAKSEPASGTGIALAILIGILLGLLVLSISCSLACGGNDALAILVLIGGIFGIFFLCKAIIKSTKKKVVAKPKIDINPQTEPIAQ